MDKGALKRGRSGIFFYGTRIIGAILLIILYHWGLQPVRTVFTRSVVVPIVSPYSNQPGSSFNVQQVNTGFDANFQINGKYRETSYKPQLGFFFLADVVALLFVTTRLRWYFYLIIIHLIALVVIIGILFLSRHGFYPGFVLVDFLISYFIPGLSIAYIPVVYHLTHKQKLTFIDHKNVESEKV